MVRGRARFSALALCLGTALIVLGTPGLAAAAGAPTVTALKASHSLLGSAGGKVTVSAKVTHARTCTFSIRPRVKGLPKTIACTSGTAKATVKIPANSSGATKSFVATLAVKGAGGKRSVTKTINEAAKPLAWGAPKLVDPAQGIPNSVSCPTATFCVLVDDHGLASTYNGTKWTSPRAIDLNLTNVLGYNPLMGVSCPTTTFCVAIDQYGRALTFNGSTWSAPKNIDAGRELLSVSCPTKTFCAAVDNSGYALTFNGTSWSGAASLGSFPLSAVSCRSASFCLALDGSNVVKYNGAQWSQPTNIDSGQLLTSLSCGTTTSCVATDDDDQAFTFNGTTWSGATDINAAIDSISCASATFCVGVDKLGDYVKFNGASWTSPTTVLNVGQSVSCPTSTFCAAVDYGGSNPSQGYLGGGHAYTFNGTTWSGAVLVDDTGGGGFTSVSCPTTAFCAAVDSSGHALTFNGTSWSAPVRAEGYTDGNGFYSVSCPTKSFCVALDGQGQAVTYNGSTWSSPSIIDHLKDLTSVSCPTTSFCAAVNASGNALSFSRGKGWTNPVSVDTGAALTAVSCVNASFCVAVDSKNRALIEKNSIWSHPKAVDNDPESNLTSVSCTTKTHCVAIEHYGPPGRARALVYNGSTWSKPTNVTPEYADATLTGTTVVACVTTTFCAAVGRWGASSYHAPLWSRAQAVDKIAPLVAVSCATRTSCVAVDRSGRTIRTS